MQITNATVERAYKPDDYGTRRVVLTLNIDPNDDADAVLGHVAGLAERHARNTPGVVLPATPPAPAPIAAVPPTPPATRSRGRPAAAPPTATPPALPPSSIDALGASEASLPTTSSTSATATPPATAPSTTTNLVAPPPTVAAPPPPAAPAPVAPATSIAPPPGASSSPAIDPHLTDKALSQLCGQIVNKHPQGTQERQATVNAVSSLRTEYTGNPALTVAAIPMDRRAEFHKRLSAIQ